jgi:metal-dependent amidase/aminoacylase/carboxypeptidase family protein
VRRELHAIPELGSHEFKTSAAIKAHLTQMGVRHKCECMPVEQLLALLEKGLPLCICKQSLLVA